VSTKPTVAVIAGPNGAGKSTAAPVLLRDTLGLVEFVNADAVALGLSGFDPDAAGLAAGRVVIERLRALASERRSFAFETTLATRSFAPWLRDLTSLGYHVSIIFLWLPNADVALHRVRARVRLGGHDIPEQTVRRRYERVVANFFRLYAPLASSWYLYDSVAPRLRLIAAGGATIMPTKVGDAELWARLVRDHGTST
jgi:predicted ABC-type ATPase